MSIHSFFQQSTKKLSAFPDESKHHTHKKGQPHNSRASQEAHKGGRSPNKPEIQSISFNFQPNTKPSVFYELPKSQQTAHTKNHNLIRDSSSLQGGKHRPQHGGIFSSVSCAPSVLSGVHRIQQAQAEHMHRFLEARRTPAYFVPILRKQGATPMQTAYAGELRPNTAHQLRLPSFPVPADSDFTFPESDLDYIATPNGVLVTYTGLMVAWIYKGHAGSRTNPNRCTFYDVAFPSLTTGEQNRITGVMLDSASFENLADAVRFVESTYSGGEA